MDVSFTTTIPGFYNELQVLEIFHKSLLRFREMESAQNFISFEDIEGMSRNKKIEHRSA